MADVSKAEKIAAAKKKLKQFQSKAKTDTKTFTAENETKPNETPDNIVSASATEYNRVDDVHYKTTSTESLTIEAAIHHANSETPPFQHNSNMNIVQLSKNYNAMPETLANQSTEPQSTMAIEEILPIQNYFNAEIHSNNIQAQQSQQQQQQQQQQQFDDVRSQLDVERMKNHELNGKILQQQKQIDDMNMALKQAYEHMQQLPAIKNNSDALQQTVDVLVKEKSDLTAKLQQKNQIIIEQDSGIAELKSRLGASRHRVAELEKDLNTIKASHAKNNEFQQGINSELDLLKTENERLKQLYQDACSENTEIQHQLSKKIKSIGEIEQKFEAKCKELEMAQLHLQQLTSSSTLEISSLSQDVAINAADEHNQQQSNANRQIIELQNLVSELTNDRDASQQQYQTYVHHLNGEIGTLTQKNQELTKQIDKLSKREESLVDHVRELEKQIQKNISVQQRLTALDDNKPDQIHLDGAKTEQIQKELDDLRAKVAASEETKQQLNVQLQDVITAKHELEQQMIEKHTKLAELSAEIEKFKDECPNTSGVLATMESDKLAASKSMTQNQELKKQLDEIQKAYIQVSNDKLELATQLQSEQYSANDIRQRFGGIEEELKTVKETLFFKDEEMIRLAHENTHLTSEVGKLEDKYKSECDELSKKYIHAKREISYLTKKLATLSKSDINEQTPNTTVETNKTEKSEPIQTFDDNSSASPSNGETVNVSLIQNENDLPQINESSIHNNHLDSDAERKLSNVDSNDNDLDVVSVTSTINIATDEAMCKLQDRFKRTMTEIAELTEEKQRLEHLVLQLQSETETIGEYIALYQTQRRLLKQREAEKDIQLHRIAADREDMKNKLEKLNRLVEMLLISKGITNPAQIVDENVGFECHTSNSNDNSESHSHALPDDVEIAPLMHNSNCCHATVIDGSNGTNKTKIIAESPANTKETATQIINLLTEIKETNLKTDNSMVPYSLNHCPCCSGSLEIV